MNATDTLRKILTVSELTSRIKDLLEDNFPMIWLSGEISNFRIPASGHFYFNLKDDKAQINAVMFRGQNMNLKFKPEDGMQINGLGRISLYEPRGTYQIIMEYVEPGGMGALQVAFEQLKAKLAQEGLFEAKHKKPIPFLPKTISIITSPTGAVVHDILRILDRRFPNVHVEIIPVKVQGSQAEKEIIQGIGLLNQRNTADVAILARGGGSLEDLMAFNTEGVVRAIFTSRIPIISAVGHETDYTLSDFVADLRMPTPSAAAEIVVPVKLELCEKCRYLQHKVGLTFLNYVRFRRARIAEICGRLTDPRRKIHDLRLRTDELYSRLLYAIFQDMRFRRERMVRRIETLRFHSPLSAISELKVKHKHMNINLMSSINIYSINLRSFLREKTTKLRALNPTAILKRGYSITRTVPDAVIIRSSNQADIGQPLEILLGQGSLHVTVDTRNQAKKQ